MKARGILLALFVVSAAMRAEEPDWFDAFRGKAFLQSDASYVAREKTDAPDAPPLFRARSVVLRYGGFSEKEREFWPFRNVLLVAMPSGRRYVLEFSFGFVDENHLDEERPFQRVASANAAFELWSSGTAGEAPVNDATEEGSCEGSRQRVRAPGGTLVFFLTDLNSPTVRTTLGEVSAATFSEDERRDLALLLRVSLENNASLRESLLSVNVALRDRALPREQRTVLLAPDPAPPDDLASWRALAHLPLDLPPFPAIQPENPIR
jgi:hypothetical protein